MSEENFIRFLLEHEGDDPDRLLLSARRWPDIDVRRAARVIEARQKIRELEQTPDKDASALVAAAAVTEKPQKKKTHSMER